MQKPDYTGTWKFNRGRSLLQIPVPDSTIFVVEHAEPVFRLSRTHVIDGKSHTFTIDLTTDGKDVTMVLGDLRVRARAYWEGETLVFDSHIIRGEDEGDNVVRYKLANNLNSIVAEERFRGKSLNYDNVWVMERQ
jgi:hypothetical protein